MKMSSVFTVFKIGAGALFIVLNVLMNAHRN